MTYLASRRSTVRTVILSLAALAGAAAFAGAPKAPARRQKRQVPHPRPRRSGKGGGGLATSAQHRGCQRVPLDEWPAGPALSRSIEQHGQHQCHLQSRIAA